MTGVFFLSVDDWINAIPRWLNKQSVTTQTEEQIVVEQTESSTAQMRERIGSTLEMVEHTPPQHKRDI